MPKFSPATPTPKTPKSILMFKILGGGASFNSIVYISPNWYTTTEANASFVMSTPGTIRNLYFHTNANTLNGNAVIMIKKNGANTTLTLTVGAGVTSGNDSAHSFTVAAGDRITVKIDPTAAGSGTISSPSVTLEFEPS